MNNFPLPKNFEEKPRELNIEAMEVLDDYILLDKVGEGGMGKVFVAKKKQEVERLVCLKLISKVKADAFNRKLFEQELQTIFPFNSPYIAQIYEFNFDGFAPYFTMEFIQGKSLGEVLSRSAKSGQPLPLDFILHVILGAVRGLKYAYDYIPPFEAARNVREEKKTLKVVHRDISPQNIMVSYDGSVKVIDFGVALTEKTKDEDVLFCGKPNYMAPEYITNGLLRDEKLLGEGRFTGDNKDFGEFLKRCKVRDLDFRVDVYALGIILWEAVTGQKALDLNKSPLSQYKEVTMKELSRASHYNSKVIKELDDLICAMTAKNVLSRPSNYKRIEDRLEMIIRKYNKAYINSDAGIIMNTLFEREKKGEINEFLNYKDIDTTFLTGYKFSDFDIDDNEKELSIIDDGDLPTKTMEDFELTKTGLKDFIEKCILSHNEVVSKTAKTSKVEKTSIKKSASPKGIWEEYDPFKVSGAVVVLSFLIIGIISVKNIYHDTAKDLASHNNEFGYSKNVGYRKELTRMAIEKEVDHRFSNFKTFWTKGKFVKRSDYEKELLKAKKDEVIIPVDTYIQLEGYKSSQHFVMINGVEFQPDYHDRVPAPADEEFTLSIVPTRLAEGENYRFLRTHKKFTLTSKDRPVFKIPPFKLNPEFISAF